MSVYTVEYSRKNPETKRNITVVKYRAQVKHNGKAHTKLFDTEREAKDWEAQKEKELSGMATVENLIAEANKITMRMLLAEHFKQHLSKQSPNSYKTNQNRSLRAIPVQDSLRADSQADQQVQVQQDDCSGNYRANPK